MSRLLAAQRALTLPGWIKEDLSRKAQAIPSLDLRFAEGKSLVDATTGANLVTFTRASSGTFVGSDGVLRTATTNLLLRSEEFDNASWGKTGLLAFGSGSITDAVASPNGSITADKITENTSTSAHNVSQTYSGTINTTAHTFSFYAKGAGRTALSVWFRGASSANRYEIGFNLATGATRGGALQGNFTSGSASIANVGNDWYRCTVTATPATGETSLIGVVYINENTSTNISNATYTGDGTSGIYLWGAQLEQSATVGEYIPTTSTINSAPRFDHNPTTGESLGLLVEEARTNSIRNNTMVGAVAGTPGTVPTNWVAAQNGITGVSFSVIGLGTFNGISYIDIRAFGTPSATVTQAIQIALEGNSSVSASASQTWTNSAWVQIVGGSAANITEFTLNTQQYNAGVFVRENTVAFTPNASSFSRYFGTVTFSASTTTAARPLLAFGTTASAAIDITLRIGLPQLEQGAFATSPILTSTAAATRSADVASITGTNFSSWYRQDEGSVYWEGTRNRTTGFPERFSLNDGTANNRIFSYFDAAANSSTFTVVTSSVNQGDIFGGGGALNSNLKTGFGFALNNVSAIYSGGVQNTDTTVTLPIVNQLVIGNGLGGTIRRISFWPQRLSNTTLQTLTQ